MAAFTFTGGAMDQNGSYAPPNNNAVPGSKDTVTFSTGGALNGTISISGSTFSAANTLSGSITNSQAAALNAGAALTIDGGGTLNTATSLTVAANATLKTSGTLSAVGEQIQGAVTQTGGTNSTKSGINIASAGGGSYTLQGGTLNMGDASDGSDSLSIGDFAGSGKFIQSGGTNNINTGGFVNIGGFGGKGSYELSGGTLQLQGGSVSLGDGTFIQTGGTHIHNAKDIFQSSSLNIGNSGVNGRYELHNGDLKLVSGSENIGGSQGSKGAFIQTGGTNTVGRSIEIAVFGATGTYELSDGTVTVGDDLEVASGGTGTFTQTGGTVKVADSLRIGDDFFDKAGFGTYTLSGGNGVRLDATRIEVSTAFNDGGMGTFNFNVGGGNAQLNVGPENTTSGAMRVGSGGIGVFNHGAGTASLKGDLYVGGAGDGTYNLNAGRLLVEGGVNMITSVGGNFPTGKSTFNMDGAGTVLDIVGGGFSGGLNLNGAGEVTFTQNNGTVNISTASAFGRNLTISSSNAANTYLLKNGTLNNGDGSGADQSTVISGSASGQSIFTQTGGTHNVMGDLIVGIGQGTYNLGGSDAKLSMQQGDLILGDFSTGNGIFNLNVNKDDNATLTITGGMIIIGDEGAGTFNQGGGTVTAEVMLGKFKGSFGSYDMTGGTLIDDLVIGELGQGQFVNRAGKHVVQDNLILGNGTSGDGTYFVSQGGVNATLDVGGDLIVGKSGQGFLQIQDTGKVTVSGEMTLAVNSGSKGEVLVQSGGSLAVDVATLAAKGTANVTVSGAGAIFSANELTIGGAVLQKVDDFNVHTYTVTGKGHLDVINQGYVSVDETLTLKTLAYDPTVSLTIGSNSSLEVGGKSGAKAGHLTVDASGRVVGFGQIDIANIVNNGMIEAKDGTLFLNATKITGNGEFLIEDGSTLDLAGSFEGTVVFGDRADPTLRLPSTLLIGNPESFEGAITGLSAGDVIEISDDALTTWSGGSSLAHVEIVGAELILTFANATTKSLQIGGDLAGSTFNIRSAPDGNTALSFTDASPQIDTHVPGSGISAYVDAMIWGWGAWDTDAGPITYWFGTKDDIKGAFDVHGATASLTETTGQDVWTALQKQTFELAVGLYSSVSGLTFAEASKVETADLVWWLTPGLSPLGRSEIPGKTTSGQIWEYFRPGPWNADPDQFSFGGDGRNTIIHEIGHTLGLAHPHDGGGEPTQTRFPGVPANADPFKDSGTNGQNQAIYTVMSYVQGWDGSPPAPPATWGTQAGLGAFDIAAIQHLYGKNNSFHAGIDTYTLPTDNAPGTGWIALWDAGGIDTISNAGSVFSATIDLRAATLADPNDPNVDPDVAAHAGGYVSWVFGTQGGFTIANGVVIENAMGGDNSDILNGNDAANKLFGGDGDDVLWGGHGNDTLTGGLGNDTFMFVTGDGIDTITDYVPGTDTIDLQGVAGLHDFAHVDIKQQGTDTVITLGSGLVLTGVTAASLTASDFTFAPPDTTPPDVAITSLGGTVQQTVVAVSGTVGIADAGSTVTVFEGATPLGTATVKGSGSWTAYVSLSGQGDHVLVAKDTDADGNTGVSNTVTFTLVSPSSVTAEQIKAAHLTMLREPLSDPDAASVATSINTGTLAYVDYLHDLANQARDTTSAILSIFDIMGTGPNLNSSGLDGATHLIEDLNTNFSIAAGWVGMGASLADSKFSPAFASTYKNLEGDAFITKVTLDAFGIGFTSPALQEAFAIYQDFFQHYSVSTDPTGGIRARGGFIADMLHQASDFAATHPTSSVGRYERASEVFLVGLVDGSVNYGDSLFP